MDMEMDRPVTLAWHETLMLHELVAYQTNCLMTFKKTVSDVSDNKLHALYRQTIKDIEKNLTELLQFYQYAPRNERDRDETRADLDTGYYAGSLLGFAKTSVKTYASTITETATSQLKQVLVKHLEKAIECHTKVFNFMHQNGMYPAYDLDKLLDHDMKNAKKALNMGEQ